MLGSILGATGITTVGIMLLNTQTIEPESVQVPAPQEKFQEITPQVIEIPQEEPQALDLTAPVPPISVAPVAPTAMLAVRAPELIHVMEPAVPSTLAPQIRVQPVRVAGGVSPVDCDDKKNKTVKGSGNVITQTVDIQSFTKLEVGGVFDVYLTQGSTESMKIEADDNLIEYVKVENIKDALVLTSECKVNIKHPYTLKIHITVKDLKELTVNGVGDVKTDGSIRGAKLILNNSGVGDVKLALEYDAFELDYSAVGNLQLTGSVNDAEMDCSGVGNVQAFELKVQNLELKHNGVGNTEVYASKSLDINFNGIGDVYYKGTPERKVIEKNGIGNVKSR